MSEKRRNRFTPLWLVAPAVLALGAAGCTKQDYEDIDAGGWRVGAGPTESTSGVAGRRGTALGAETAEESAIIAYKYDGVAGCYVPRDVSVAGGRNRSVQTGSISIDVKCTEPTRPPEAEVVPATSVAPSVTINNYIQQAPPAPVPVPAPQRVEVPPVAVRQAAPAPAKVVVERPVPQVVVIYDHPGYNRPSNHRNNNTGEVVAAGIIGAAIGAAVVSPDDDHRYGEHNNRVHGHGRGRGDNGHRYDPNTYNRRQTGYVPAEPIRPRRGVEGNPLSSAPGSQEGAWHQDGGNSGASNVDRQVYGGYSALDRQGGYTSNSRRSGYSR